MGKSSLLANLKIRTSLILVLVFFLIMLVAGAALGVLSLRANNQALQSIVQNQRLGASLYEAIDGYKDVQTILGRAVASFIVNSDQQQANEIAAEWGSAESASALSEESRNLIGQARSEYEQSLSQFAAYRDQIKHVSDPESRYAQVTDGYRTLMEAGVQPLFDML